MAAVSYQLGASERLFAAFRGFTSTNVVRVVALDVAREGALEPARIAIALRALQARHPLLNVKLADGEPLGFVTCPGAPIPLIVTARRDDQHFVEVLERVLNAPLPMRDGPLMQLHYVYAPAQARAELLLVCDHVICDGVSMNALSAELLALCAGEPVGDELGAPGALSGLLPPFATHRRWQGFARSLARFGGMTVLRRLYDRPRGGATTCFETAVLGRDETEVLRDRARAEGTTVTGALMAATLMAAQRVRGTPRLALSVPVNLRSRIASQVLTASDLGNYTNVVYLDAARSRALWPSARALKQRLSEVTRDEQLLAPLSLVYRAGRMFVKPARPPFAHVLVSSSGIVPLRVDHGSFRAREFFSATSAVMLSADFSFFCNTFDGRLRMNLIFLQEVVSRGVAREVLTHVHQLLGSSGHGGTSSA